MEVIVLPDAQSAGAIAADAIQSLLKHKPQAVLGLATGSSPLPIYDALARKVNAGEVSFAEASGFALDEYVGLRQGHPESYREVIRREFTERVNIDPERVYSPDGSAHDIPAACQDYEEAIASAGGIDLQILGLGTDGHIGFNEPGSSLASRTRIKTLTEQTRKDNARFFDSEEQVPHHVITQGLGTIMQARHLVMIVTGSTKAEAAHQCVEGAISALWPGSVLQMHQHVTVLVDTAAASRLQLRDYYRHTWENKPSWQGI